MQSLCPQHCKAPGYGLGHLPCLHRGSLSRIAFRGCAQPYESRQTDVRRCHVVCADSRTRSGLGASSRNSYSPPIQRNPSSAVHSVSFNQQVRLWTLHMFDDDCCADLAFWCLQLLIVLCIPAAALGIPFALSHPIICIVIPLIIYCNPSLQEVVKPLLAALLQLILSGLRPAGSPKSAAFPWQQVTDSADAPHYLYMPC